MLCCVFEDNEASNQNNYQRSESHNEACFSNAQSLLLIGCLKGFIWILKIQIMYIDIKHQLADILTKRNFTRYEWSNLLYLFNISHFSSLCSAQNFSLTGCPTMMAKRMQEQKEEGQDCGKIKPNGTRLSLSRQVLYLVDSPIASKSPGLLKASSRQIGCSGKPDARRENKFQTRCSVEVLKNGKKDALLDGRAKKPVATEKIRTS